jgi:hypothetical protein
LFVKFMASPRLHTVKTGKIGPKASCCMTASDVRTSVNSVGAVEGNKARYNSKARCPATRCEQQALRKDIRTRTWERRGGGSCGWPQPSPSWAMGCQGALSWGWGEGCAWMAHGRPAARPQQLERVLSLQLCTWRQESLTLYCRGSGVDTDFGRATWQGE